MAYTIAVAGKGGCGKTTVSCLLARALLAQSKKPILAVDADPNANLNIGLGIDFDETIADFREETLRQPPAGMSRLDFVKLRLQESIAEGNGIDLLVMGRPEGPGCYCAVNNLLRDYLSKLAQNYPYVIIDNEAGMEHLSRRTANNIDLLLLVSDPSVVGIRACARAYETALSIPLKVARMAFIFNRVNGTISDQAQKELKKIPVPLAGKIPFDAVMITAAEKADSVFNLPENAAVNAFSEILDTLKIP